MNQYEQWIHEQTEFYLAFYRNLSEDDKNRLVAEKLIKDAKKAGIPEIYLKPRPLAPSDKRA